MLLLHKPIFLALLPLPFIIYYIKKKFKISYKISTKKLIGKFPETIKSKIFKTLPFLWILSMVLMVLTLAEPTKKREYEEFITYGVDIILTLDCSGSMLSEDFKPKNRLNVAKEVVKEFIEGRRNDRIGLVVFSADAITQCPLTTDYNVLLSLLEKVDVGIIEDGTAIGNALSLSVARLKNSKAKSKVIILLTDGQNNRGEVSPLTAMEIAKTYGIKVYTVGVGTKGFAMMPYEDPIFGKRYVQVPVNIDEELLQKISQETGAKYFRATDPEKLKEIYKNIDQMEKSEVKTKKEAIYKTKYLYTLLPSFIIFLIYLFLSIFLRVVP
jgi:Ca-activated chloride channel family protein